jgi:hypothetical protein
MKGSRVTPNTAGMESTANTTSDTSTTSSTSSSGVATRTPFCSGYAQTGVAKDVHSWPAGHQAHALGRAPPAPKYAAPSTQPPPHPHCEELVAIVCV